MDADPASDLIQDAFSGTFIVNSGVSRMITRDGAVTAVDENTAALVAVHRPRSPTPTSSPDQNKRAQGGISYRTPETRHCTHLATLAAWPSFSSPQQPV